MQLLMRSGTLSPARAPGRQVVQTAEAREGSTVLCTLGIQLEVSARARRLSKVCTDRD